MRLRELDGSSNQVTWVTYSPCRPTLQQSLPGGATNYSTVDCHEMNREAMDDRVAWLVRSPGGPPQSGGDADQKRYR